MQVSFGMIFSIVIIVVTILVAGYVIMKFLETRDDAACKLFYQKLQDRVDSAWKGEGTSIELNNEPLINLPGKVKKVCFGNSTQNAVDSADREILEELKYYGDKGDNLIFSPNDACGSTTFSYSLEHVVTEGFFCSDVKKGKIELVIKKDKKEVLVSLCPDTENCGEKT